ncbi:MAG: hypothetical protein ABJA74_08720 [Lapillicoccus sp.]
MIEPPHFRTVLRGYDPDQVSAVMSELSSSLTIARRTAADRTMELTKAQQREATLNADLDEAVARLAAAEKADSRNQVFSDVGTRVTTILRLADEEAGQLRAEGDRYAHDLRRSAEAESARMKAAAVEAADAIVLQASREAAAHREADAALHAKVADAEKAAAQIVESARQDALLEGRRIQVDFEATERTRDQVHADLGGVLELLTSLDAELARDVDDLPPAVSRGVSASRSVLRAEA